MIKDEAKRRIREVGLRATIPRISIIQTLAKSKRPLSHAEMVTELGDYGGDQATVYRTLITFVKVGLLQVASKASGIARYELNKPNQPIHRHPHFVCETCGIVTCLPKTVVISPEDDPWREIVKTAELQFVGDCLGCRKAAG